MKRNQGITSATTILDQFTVGNSVSHSPQHGPRVFKPTVQQHGGNHEDRGNDAQDRTHLGPGNPESNDAVRA